MKKLVLATVVALTATTASAIDVDFLGQTIAVGAESDINYVTGIEEWEWTATPYAAFTTSVGVTLSAETEIDMRGLDQDEIFKGIDYTAEYGVNGVTLYTEISSDRDWEFGDITVGAKVKF
jgi:hypothetical protein